MQSSNTRRSNGALEEQDNLANMARLLEGIGWEKRLCDLSKEEVLHMVAHIQAMKDIRDEFTEQGLFEFEQSVTGSHTEDDLNDPIPF